MALTLTIYQFAKKNNSTAQPPANAQSRQYSGLLIDDTNVVNPMIRLLYNFYISFISLTPGFMPCEIFHRCAPSFSPILSPEPVTK